MNLISNSIKFTEPGKVITIRYKDKSVTIDDEDVDCIQVSIEDKGIGIPENELGSIFNKFSQSSKNKSGSGGTGLGLAITREIIIAHKGKIWAENLPGGGAKFTFIIPRGKHETEIGG